MRSIPIKQKDRPIDYCNSPIQSNQEIGKQDPVLLPLILLLFHAHKYQQRTITNHLVKRSQQISLFQQILQTTAPIILRFLYTTVVAVNLSNEKHLIKTFG